MKSLTKAIGVIIFWASVSLGERRNVKSYGPHVNQTRGVPWPYPQQVTNYGDNFMIVRPSMFRFQTGNQTCDMIEEALKRYYAMLLREQFSLKKVYVKGDNKTWKEENGYRGYLDVLKVTMLNPCEFMPHEDMDEGYKIIVDSAALPGQGELVAKTSWGILRGLETFSQLVHHTNQQSALKIKSTKIIDYPRFPFRSVLLDTSRHYLSKKVLLQNLDLMAMNKMNVFHWHIVDDPSFPYQSKFFPQLSDKGAYHSYTHVYTQQDIADIIEYARVRGIRVVPEFDTPGHTQSWGPGIPGLLTTCYKGNMTPAEQPHPDGTFGPIDPTVYENYVFLKKLFSEIISVFHDRYLHLGGDEVDFTCWESNPKIQAFMLTKNLTDYSQLEGFYMQNLVDIIESFPQNKSYIVWQEVFDNGVKIHEDAVVNVWKGESFQEEMEKVTLQGYRTLLYSCWYLDMISWGVDWPRYYRCDPQNFNGTAKQMSLVLGGGAALWGEFVDSTNVIARLWPRASAPAERLWSSEHVNDTEKAAPRLEEHRCRLLSRGYNVEPANGPGFCLVTWD